MGGHVARYPAAVTSGKGGRWSIALWAFVVVAVLVAAYLAARGTETGRDAYQSPTRRPWGALPFVAVLVLAGCAWLLRFAPRRWQVVAGLVLAAASCVAAAVIGLTMPRPPTGPLTLLPLLLVVAMVVLALAGVAYAVAATGVSTRTTARPALAGAVAVAILAPLAVAVFTVPAAYGVIDRANAVSSPTDAPAGVLRTRAAGLAWAHTFPGDSDGNSSLVATAAGFGVELPGGVGVVDRATGRLRWTYRTLDAAGEELPGGAAYGAALASSDGRELAVTLTRHGLDHVTVLDAASGRVRTDVVPPSYRDADEQETRSTTLVGLDAHALYFYGGDTLTAVDRGGDARWHVGATQDILHAVSTPAGLLTVLAGGAENADAPAVVMRDARTGKVRWTFGRAGESDLPDLLLSLHGGAVVLGEPRAGRVESLRLADGRVSWRRTLAADEIELSADGRTLLTLTGKARPKGRLSLTLRGLDAATGGQRWHTVLDAANGNVNPADRPRVRTSGFGSPELAAVPSGTFLLGYLSAADKARLATVRPGDGKVRQLTLPKRCDETVYWPRLLTSGDTAAVVCVPPTGTPSRLLAALR